MDRSSVTRYISGLTGEKESVGDRAGKQLFSTLRACLSVAVGPARKRVVLPVMKINVLKETLEFLHADP